jgi:proline iminopeptidase
MGQTSGTAPSSDSTLIYYRVFGSGKPLLIINGGPGMNSDGFEGLATKLSQHNQAIIYDQRGTGKSGLGTLDSTTITMKLMVDDIESLRKHLQIEKWSVLGHSFGGMLASYYATQYPDHIERLILSSSGGIDLSLLDYAGKSINGRLSKSQRDSVELWTKRINAGDTTHYAKLQRGMALAPAYIYHKKFVPVIAERLTQGNQTVNQLIWSDMQRIKFDCSRKLKSFDKPVLIIQGKKDIIKPETSEKAHRVLKNSRVVFVENSGHYGWLDNEPVYIHEVESFLGRE